MDNLAPGGAWRRCWFAVALALCGACGVPESSGPDLGTVVQDQGGCGVERWAVKTGTDPDVGLVTFDLLDTTVATLLGFPMPASYPDANRISPWEEQVFRLRDVRMVEYKLETDSDYHIVIWDCAQRNHLITEIPAPSCVGASSPFLPGITAARAAFDKHLTATPNFQFDDEVVSLIGVGYFDPPHGQTGAAPNGLELHAILGICFGSGCTDQIFPDGGTPGGFTPCTPAPTPDGGTGGGGKKGCGCQSGATLAAPWALLVLLRSRRRSSRAPRPHR